MPPTATTVAAAGRPTEDHRAVLVVLVPLVGIAAATVATTMPPLPELLARKQLPALIALLALAIATTAFPAPLAAGVTVRFAVVAVVLSTAVLYGPALAAFVASVAELVGNIAQRKTFLKVVYNVTSALLGGAAAGVVASALGGTRSPASVLAASAGAALALHAINTTFYCVARSRATATPMFPLLREALGAIAIPSILISSLVPLVVVAWTESPLLAITALGPLVGIGLHQVSAIRAAHANTIALTDPLTALGNRRHFDERLARKLDRAERDRAPLSLCLIDLDGLKAINDTHGHAAGDEALVATASCLRRGGEAFRHGGDEFALLLPGHSEPAAVEVARAVCARIRELTDRDGRRLSASAGTATFSGLGSSSPADLLRIADADLYARKVQRR